MGRGKSGLEKKKIQLQGRKINEEKCGAEPIGSRDNTREGQGGGGEKGVTPAGHATSAAKKLISVFTK